MGKGWYLRAVCLGSAQGGGYVGGVGGLQVVDECGVALQEQLAGLHLVAGEEGVVNSPSSSPFKLDNLQRIGKMSLLWVGGGGEG